MLGIRLSQADKELLVGAIKDAIRLWLEVEAEESGIRSAETLELFV